MRDDHAADRQAETRPLRFDGHPVAALTEPLEDRGPVLARDARAVVDTRTIPRSPVRPSAHAHPSGPVLREFHGIRQQVDDHLRQPVGVAAPAAPLSR